MQFFRRLAFTSVLALTAALTGCSPEGSVYTTDTVSVAGNWQFSSSAAAATKLPSLSGVLSGTGSSITAILHADSASSCIAPTTAIALSGTTSAQGITTLTSSNFPSGVLTISGTLALDGKSFTSATYTVAGSTSCAFASPANATANDFSPISGTYNGKFSDSAGPVLTISALLAQSPSSDANGNFTLTGEATFGNACFSNNVPISNTQVTGGNFTFTYADPVTTNSVVANGTFSTDGTTLTISNWTLTGPCGPDSGTGSLTKQ
jgi:hypothetical protein